MLYNFFVMFVWTEPKTADGETDPRGVYRDQKVPGETGAGEDRSPGSGRGREVASNEEKHR